MNSTLTDIATALTGSLTANGEKTASGNQPMGGFIHTGVGNASARTNYSSAAQIQDGSLTRLGSVAGTNTITASLTPAITAYVSGQTFTFIPAVTITGAATININSVGAKSLVKNGPSGYVALIAGDLIAGLTYEIIYDDAGSDQFVVANTSYPAVSAYAATGDRTYLNENGSNATAFDISGSVTESTFESVGPTGSSATNTWSVMDILPSSARIAILSIKSEAIRTTGDGSVTINVYRRMTGNATAVGNQTAVVDVIQYATDGAAVRNRTQIEVPLDTSRRFDITWAVTGDADRDIDAYLVGFIA